jgi:FdhD protein
MEKAARAGIGWVASRSVPTTLAVEIAAAAGITIVGRAPARTPACSAPARPVRGELGDDRAEVPPFGAILAGGESRRFGSPKALAPVGGVRIIDRVVGVLGRVVPDLVLLANEPELFEDLRLPTRPDVRPGLGALGGLHTGLIWARDEGRPGILAVACDMPFPCEPLLGLMRDLAFGPPDGGASPPDL